MSEDIKEDFLDVDSKIPGQNYVCLSFVSPNKVLKEKETFFATKFLEYVINDNDMIVQDIRQKMLDKEVTINYDNVAKLYDDWKYLKNEDLEAEFFELNDYKTSMRGLKVRGVYDTYKEASIRAQVLRKRDSSFNVFVGQVGYWLPWDPECEAIQEQEYQENQLNELVKKYKENLSNRDDLYDQVRNERIEKAKKEVNAKKELIRAQNEVHVPKDTEKEDIENIEKLRSIVDESDKLYYDNLKTNTKTNTETNTETNTKINTETNIETNSKDNVEQNNEILKTDNIVLDNFEKDDPWLNRKN